MNAYRRPTPLINFSIFFHPGRSYKQPLDVSINKPFRKYVCELFEQHLDANLESYVDVKLTTGERRLLTQPCSQLDVIKYSFKKWFHLSNNVNGSEDDFVNIKGIEGYKTSLPEIAFQLLEEENGDDDEEFEENDDDDEEFEEDSTDSESNYDSVFYWVYSKRGPQISLSPLLKTSPAKKLFEIR